MATDLTWFGLKNNANQPNLPDAGRIVEKLSTASTAVKATVTKKNHMLPTISDYPKNDLLNLYYLQLIVDNN